jgi:hypothetical protein
MLVLFLFFSLPQPFAYTKGPGGGEGKERTFVYSILSMEKKRGKTGKDVSFPSSPYIRS